MLSRTLTTAALTGALALTSLSGGQDAYACDPAGPSPLAVVPLNGDRVRAGVDILVIGNGMKPLPETEYSLTDRAGAAVELEVEHFDRPGLFSWLAVYRPVEPLSPTAYDFFASYPFGGDDETIGTSFQVQDGEEATLAKPSIASWSTASFSPEVTGQCASYDNATRLVIDMPRQGDTPLWYEVEVGVEDGSDSQTFAVVPGFAEDDGTQVIREMHVGFFAGCVAVTPIGPNGERGETAESCVPDRCLLADPEEVDLGNLWENAPECQGSAPAQNSNGGSANEASCSVSSNHSGAPSPLAFVAAMLMLAFATKRNQTGVRV